MTGVELIAAERARQVEAEGWTPEHDAAHGHGVLAAAARCYATPEGMGSRYRPDLVPPDWPWDARFWKPTPLDRVRELVKAGALIAAEIDRIANSHDGPCLMWRATAVPSACICRAAA